MIVEMLCQPLYWAPAKTEKGIDNWSAEDGEIQYGVDSKNVTSTKVNIFEIKDCSTYTHF